MGTLVWLRVFGRVWGEPAVEEDSVSDGSSPDLDEHTEDELDSAF